MSKEIKILVAKGRLLNRDSLDLVALIQAHFNPGAILVESDGKLAFKRALSVCPHIAIVDVQLPTLNGYELVERLQQFSLIKSIFCCAENTPADVQLAHSIGCQFMSVPLQKERVLKQLEEALKA